MNGGENVAKQIEGVYDKLIECAKAEFLEKGFKDASLRTIAKNAHTSTNSIYVRFGDKAGLFDALVKPHYETVMNRYIKTQTEFQSLPADIQRISIEKQSGDCMIFLITVMNTLTKCVSFSPAVTEQSIPLW